MRSLTTQIWAPTLLVSVLVATCTLPGFATLLPASEVPSQGQGCCCLLSESVALSHMHSSRTHSGAHSTPTAFLHMPRWHHQPCMWPLALKAWDVSLQFMWFCEWAEENTVFFSCVYCEGRNDKENKTEDGWSFLFHPIRSFFSLTLPCLLCAPHKDNIPISKKLYPLSKQVHKSKYLDGAVKSSIIENTEAQMVTSKFSQLMDTTKGDDG